MPQKHSNNRQTPLPFPSENFSWSAHALHQFTFFLAHSFRPVIWYTYCNNSHLFKDCIDQFALVFLSFTASDSTGEGDQYYAREDSISVSKCHRCSDCWGKGNKRGLKWLDGHVAIFRSYLSHWSEELCLKEWKKIFKF